MNKHDSIAAPLAIGEHASTDAFCTAPNDTGLGDPVSGAISLCVNGGVEMIKIAPDGFYVRGEKVAQDATEAREVYDAFVLFFKQVGCIP